MANGKVKWFDNTKGFGFIIGSNGQEIFVHFTAIASDGYRTLVEGEDVLFDLVNSERGLKAENVQRLNPPPPRQPQRQPSHQPHPYQRHHDRPDTRPRI